MQNYANLNNKSAHFRGLEKQMMDNKISVQYYNMLHHIVQRVSSQSHYADVIIIEMASQITSLAIVCSIVYSDADQRKHQSSASLAFVRGIHRGPGNSPRKWPVTRKMFQFDDVIVQTIVSGCMFQIIAVTDNSPYIVCSHGANMVRNEYVRISMQFSVNFIP